MTLSQEELFESLAQAYNTDPLVPANATDPSYKKFNISRLTSRSCFSLAANSCHLKIMQRARLVHCSLDALSLKHDELEIRKKSLQKNKRTQHRAPRDVYVVEKHALRNQFMITKDATTAAESVGRRSSGRSVSS